MPGPEPAAVIAVDLLAVHPVGPPEPGVVQEAGTGEQVVADLRRLVGLRRELAPRRATASFSGAMFRRFPSRSNAWVRMYIERPSQERMSGSATRHVLPLDLVCRFSPVSGSRSSITVSDSLRPVAGRAAAVACRRRGTPSGRPRSTPRPLLDQHAAGNRPGRFQLLVGHHAAVVRGGAEPPDQPPVVRAEAVDPAVGRAEQDPALIDRGRRIDAAAGRVAPGGLAGAGVQGMDRVGIDGGQKDLAAGDDRRC